MAGNKQTRIVDVRVTSNVGKTMQKGTTQAKGMAGALKGVQGAAMAATGGIRAMTAALLSSGVGAVVVAIGALVGGISGLINKSKEFDKAFSNLAAVTGKTKDEIASLKENAKDLGATTAFTATQVLELSTEFAKLGFSTTEILNASEATLDLAAAAGVDLAEAATVAGSTLRGFGLDTEETQRVVDVMAKSFTSSALDMEKFKESMKLVAPIAKTTKVSVEESAAALSILADRGVSGSMAGTQLRRIMSDLAQKTGKDFATSLEITADRLDKAKSTAEKLAIAKELVGDRAKGSLIALAENREELERLKVAYDNAGGAAEEMAEKKLDNLEGSLTKLSSAWDGFMLNLEDGSGVIGKLAKGAVDILTDSVTKLKNNSTGLGLVWDAMMNFFESVPTRLKIIGLDLEEFGLKARLVAEKIPFWGDEVDEMKLNTQLVAVRDAQAKALADLKSFQEKGDELMGKASLAFKGIKLKEVQDTEDATKAKEKIEEGFVEGSVEKDKDAQKQKEEDRKKFLEKLSDLEKKEQAKTEEEKIAYRKQKHLDELAQIEMDDTERAAVKLRIEKIYQDQLQALKDENALKVADKLKEAEMMAMQDEQAQKIARNEQKMLEDLAELERLGATEEQKLQLKKYYQDEEDRIVAEGKQKQKEAEQELNRAKMQLAVQGLGAIDALTQAFAGKSEKAQKKAFKISKALRLAQATLSGIEGVQNAYTTAQASPLTIAMPAYPAIQAGIAGAFAAAQIASIAKTQFQGGGGGTSNLATGGSGGSGGGRAAQAPAFNVIGQTSAGENMIADTIGQANSQPTRAYVVESDISNSQELARKADNLASVG